MNRRLGGLWLDLSNLDTDRIERIVTRGSGTFTIALPAELISEGASTLALVSTRPGYVEYVALITAGRTVSDLERKAQVGPVQPLRGDVRVDNLIAALPPRVKQHARAPTRRGSPVPPATWRYLLDRAVVQGMLNHEDLRALQDSLVARSTRQRDALPEAVAFERDAFATAFEMLGGSAARKTFINSAAASAEAPFIRRLRHRDIRHIEESMIAHDVLTFPGSKALRPHIVGAVEVCTPSGTLTILNANRTRIERTLGVDLIYYNHRHASFALVQYKRLRGEQDPVYRPSSDRSLERELRRMRDFESRRNEDESTYETYRLISSPFFLKLCKAKTSGDWNGRMLPGMYFPLALWDRLVNSPAARGPRGGMSIGFHNAKRRFTNSEFTRMLRDGWIGTASKATERIEDLLVAQLEADHSVVAAVHEPDRVAVDYARDSLGRFASDYDETAV